MYEAFYGLRERPFNLTPDPKYLFLSDKHREAFAHLLYGIKNGNGFVMISGEIGTGKTTITRNLMQQLDDDTEIAFIFNPSLAPVELLKKINTEFGVEAQSDNALDLVDRLNVHLLEANAQGRNCVLVIDESQNLTPPVLEQIRLLSNLETETQKLLQIVLIGQPELMEMLSLHELRQLNQRITARYHLNPLDEDETIQYIAYRIHVAGGRRKVQFSKAAVKQIFKLTGGTPRMINALCDRALLIGYTREVRTIEPDIIKQASQEIWGDPKLYKSAARKYKARQKEEKHAAKTARPPRQPLQWGRLLPNPTISLVVILLVAGGVFLWPDIQHFILEWREQSLAWRNAPAETDPKGGESASGEQSPTSAEGMDIGNETVNADESVTPAHAEEGGATNTQDSQHAETLTFLEALAAQSEDEDVDAAAMAAVLQDNGADAAAGDAETSLSPFAAAMQPVLRYWAVEVPDSDLPADASPEDLAAFAESQGLIFDTLAPSLEQLLALKVPVMIRLKESPADEAEPSRWLAMLGETDEGVRVGVRNNEFVVAQSALRAFFDREAYLFWEDPEPNAPILSLGRSGAAVAALKAKLHALGRLPESNRSNQYDPETARAVAILQAETGLTVDSIAGEQVRMVLHSWLRDAGIAPETLSVRSGAVAAPSRPDPSPATAPQPSETPEPEPEPEPVAEPEDTPVEEAGPESESPTPVVAATAPTQPPEAVDAPATAPVAPIQEAAEMEAPAVALPDSPVQQPDAGAEAPEAYMSPLWPSPFTPDIAVEGEEEDFVFQGEQSLLPQMPASVSSVSDAASENALVDVRDLPEPDTQAPAMPTEAANVAETSSDSGSTGEQAADAENGAPEADQTVAQEPLEADDAPEAVHRPDAVEAETEAGAESVSEDDDADAADTADSGIAEVVYIGPLMQDE